MPLISSFVINDQFLIDFLEKANFFNLRFAKQCGPIENDSPIPTGTNYLCNTKVSAVDFEDQYIYILIY